MTTQSQIATIEPHDTTVAIADPMVSMIERVVMNPDADLDKLERMLAMKERIDAHNAGVEFARALAAARAEIPPIMKDAAVDYTPKGGRRVYYQHETLAGIAKVIDPILSQHGLSYRFRTNQEQGLVRVTCIVTHMAGHSEETSLACAPDGSGNKNPFQAVGSAVTYLQRYTLKAALGLSAEVDDDAQSAAPRPDQRQRDDHAPRQHGAETEQKPRDNNARAQELIARISAVDSLERLEDGWRQLSRADRELPGVIAAKDAAKSRLSSTQKYDDYIPYGGPNDS